MLDSHGFRVQRLSQAALLVSEKAVILSYAVLRSAGWVLSLPAVYVEGLQAMTSICAIQGSKAVIQL